VKTDLGILRDGGGIGFKVERNLGLRRGDDTEKGTLISDERQRAGTSKPIKVFHESTKKTRAADWIHI
jgi:hypothetical protein